MPFTVGSLALLLVLAACQDWSLPISPEDPPEPEEPTDPPKPTPGVSYIHLADADGSNPRVLVAGDLPAWSPDGRRIAFRAEDQIRVIDADGTGATVLGFGRQPAWSPDGTEIAFVTSEGLAVMRDDGSDIRFLLPHGFRDDTYAEWDMGVGKPAWSPEGDRIAFEHLGDGDLVPAQIFVMKADGGDPRRLTPTQGIQYAESDPAWSPDGSEIVFWSFGYGIAAVPAAGGTPREIYRNFPAVAYGAKPVWSPDGRTILFTANLHFQQGPAIWAVASGGGPAQVVVPGGFNPTWSPDGARMAFVRRDGDA